MSKLKPRDVHYDLGANEFGNNAVRFIQALVAEFVGTFILLFFGVGSCTQSQEIVPVSLVFGFSLTIAVVVAGQISGGHVNPAVTIGLLVIGRITFIRAICYVIVQFCGAIFATFILSLLVSGEISQGHTILRREISAFQGMCLELAGTTVLLLVILGSVDNKKVLQPIAPFMIGLALATNCLAIGKYTGSSLNPARTMGTAILSNDFSDHWIYWVGPILGGILGAVIYVVFIEEKNGSSAVGEAV
ncbi:unnamed protein product [Hermetia illucens]|uniref:Aquaporin n=1 Tax=Hermetia illucens TaxID=343691 RepID=A0A7R8YSH7_HERIL|nr:aquaporin-1-like [Hermetia illucens]CAD7082560.1 unnamed protein product [Hermetia illucens]